VRERGTNIGRKRKRDYVGYVWKKKRRSDTGGQMCREPGREKEVDGGVRRERRRTGLDEEGERRVEEEISFVNNMFMPKGENITICLCQKE
jgi:hypothetical protein